MLAQSGVFPADGEADDDGHEWPGPRQANVAGAAIVADAVVAESMPAASDAGDAVAGDATDHLNSVHSVQQT